MTIKFVQIAVAPVMRPTETGSVHQTNEVYALDDRGRLWRRPDGWGGKAVEWKLMPSPEEPAEETAEVST